MTGGAQTKDRGQGWLAQIQVSLFAVTMGLGGLGLAWRTAARALGWPAAIGEAVLALAALCFVAIAALYVAKLARHGSSRCRSGSPGGPTPFSPPPWPPPACASMSWPAHRRPA